ncbi:aspartate/glutamate racemase family protein (plasmid) [Agrobacterium sp. rho-8.1]|nr:amino acid racemase [Agrobacterium sp. rho-8.1]
MNGTVAGQNYRLGIIGGLGPLASANFCEVLTKLTPVAGDQDHIPLVMLNVTHTPDRTVAIVESGPSPLPSLSSAIKTLNQLGVELVVMTCNTAHHWFDELSSQSRARMLHIADCTITDIMQRSLGRRIAVLGTEGTVRSGFYQRKLAAAGYEPIVPSDRLQLEVKSIINYVKSGHLIEANTAATNIHAHLGELKADAVILACTELPIVWRSRVEAGCLTVPEVNPTVCLARSTLKALGYEQRMKRTSKSD